VFDHAAKEEEITNEIIHFFFFIFTVLNTGKFYQPLGI